MYKRQLLDATPDIVDKPAAYAVDHLRGDIVFDNVNFQYELSLIHISAPTRPY